MESIETRYQALEQQVLQRNPNADVKRLRTAFDYANAHHGTQLRKSGEPYITHPLAVADSYIAVWMSGLLLSGRQKHWLRLPT